MTLESANARDMLALKVSLGQLPLIRSYIEKFRAAKLRELWVQLDELADGAEVVAQVQLAGGCVAGEDAGFAGRGHRRGVITATASAGESGPVRWATLMPAGL